MISRMDRSRSLHVLLLTPGFPSDEQETDCIPALQNVVRLLHAPDSGVQVTVVALQYPFRKDHYNWHGVPVYALNGRNRRHPWRWWIWRKAMQLIMDLHRRKPIDVLHAMWLTECPLIAQQVGQSLQVPVIATLMGQDARQSNRYLPRLDHQNMYITANSPFVASVFEASSGRKADGIIPLGIDTDNAIFTEAEVRRTIDVFGAGAFIELKDYTAFIRIIARIKSIRPQVRAVLAGDGVLRQSLEALAAELKLGESLQFTGHLPREEVLQRMRQSRIFLHPSTYEAQGYVLLEALACGMQVVCRPVGLYQPGCSAIHVRQDENALAAQVLQLLEKPVLHHSQFPVTREKSVEDFHQLYRQKVQENEGH